MNNNKHDTEWLGRQIESAISMEDLQKILDANPNILVHDNALEYYLKCLENHNVTIDILKKNVASTEAIDRGYLRKFLLQKVNVSRDTLLILAIFGKLEFDEVQNLLKYANLRRLYGKDKRDDFFIFAFQTTNKPDNPCDFYEQAEAFLEKKGYAPLCKKKRPNNKEKASTKISRKNYILPQDEHSTIIMDSELGKVSSLDELDHFIQRMGCSVRDSDTLKLKDATTFILQCANANGISNKTFFRRIYYNLGLMQQSTLCHIFDINNKKTISRDNVIAFGLIAGMNIHQINRALKYNNSPELYIRNTRDLYIAFCIIKGCTYVDTEIELYNQGEDPLSQEFVDIFIDGLDDINAKELNIMLTKEYDSDRAL